MIAAEAHVIKLKTFRVNLAKDARDWPEAVMSLYVRKATLEGLGLILKRFPVDTGVHRANVNVSIQAKDTEFQDTEKFSGNEGSPASGDEIGAGVFALSDWKLGDMAWVTGTGPGTAAMEFGLYPNPPKFGTWNKKEKKYEVLSVGGYSKQAPRGMFRIAAEEVVAGLKAKTIRVTEREIDAVTGKRIRKKAS